MIDDPELMTEEEQDKKVLVIVRWGKGVDYEEKQNTALTLGDIQLDFPRQSWEQIRAEHSINDMSSDYDNYPLDGEDDEHGGRGGVVDSYDNVDEYLLGPLDYVCWW